MLVLYHQWSSVCAQKVRIALSEKKLPWESRHIDLFHFENWSPEYVKINPKGVVPTLLHGGATITESNIILEYLDDAFPSVSLRPEKPDDRALMRSWFKQTDEVAHPAVVAASFNLRHMPRWKDKYSMQELQQIATRHPDPEGRAAWLDKFKNGVSPETEKASYRKLDRMVQKMEEQLGKSAWLAGNSFTLADIAIAPYVNRIEVLAHPEIISADVRPQVADWWKRVTRRPGYEEGMSFKSPDPHDPIKR